MPSEGARAPKPLLQTSFNESQPAVSPDGRSLSYVSNETGRQEVYVQPYPGPGGKSRISSDGGSFPVWAHDGHELYYRGPTGMMGVLVNSVRGVATGPSRLLFKTTGPVTRYGVGRDGRFLMIQNLPASATARPITVVLNWFHELKEVTM